jgi:hypothetical protein
MSPQLFLILFQVYRRAVRMEPPRMEMVAVDSLPSTVKADHLDLADTYAVWWVGDDYMDGVAYAKEWAWRNYRTELKFGRYSLYVVSLVAPVQTEQGSFLVRVVPADISADIYCGELDRRRHEHEEIEARHKAQRLRPGERGSGDADPEDGRGDRAE